jgi:hypothetical protein
MAVGSLPTMELDPALLDWLLDADPTLRWQVERELVGAPREVWGATRARIATEGFGARLLALQDPDGQWAGGSFFPDDFDFHGPEAAPSRQVVVHREVPVERLRHDLRLPDLPPRHRGRVA